MGIGNTTQTGLMCMSGWGVGCGKAIHIKIDQARYNKGGIRARATTEACDLVYVREVHKKLEQKAKKAGFIKTDLDPEWLKHENVDADAYSEQQLINYRYCYLCQICANKLYKKITIECKSKLSLQQKKSKKKTKTFTETIEDIKI